MIIPAVKDFELNKLIAEDVSEETAIKTSPNQPLRFYILLSLHASQRKGQIYLGVKLWLYALKLPLMILLGAFINTPTEERMNSFVYIGNSSRMSLRMNSING